MSQTPTKMTVKRLPMIVDIALDNDGKQLYQVHESSKMVRKEMPRSTNFTAQTLVPDEEKTPVRKILGTISPSTLNQKKPDDLEIPQDLSLDPMARKMPSVPMLHNNEFLHGVDTFGVPDPSPAIPSNSCLGTSSQLSFDGMPTTPNNEDTDIWSSDVETAFEEVLSIIPKNGLSKIKISGRSCGRNELISDYIYQKTGKFRTRKQVSSHIQVIKNLGQKHDIIKLINEGPSFENEQQRIENMNKFEEIFSRITLAKSMGVNNNTNNNTNNNNNNTTTNNNINNSNHHHHHNNNNNNHNNNNSHKRSNSTGQDISNYYYPQLKRKKYYHFNVENFFMAFMDLTNTTYTLSRQSSSIIKNLKLKEGANLSHRFPGLNDLTSLDIPFIHCMVNMKIPLLNEYQSLQTNYQISSNIPCLSVFSCVYSFGQEVLKINEATKFNQNLTFLEKFWNFFFKELLSRGEQDIIKALKGITIIQIIYDLDTNDKNRKMIAKSKIQSILLWEFSGVDSYSDAVTTISRLSFPSTIHNNALMGYQSFDTSVAPIAPVPPASSSTTSATTAAPSAAPPPPAAAPPPPAPSVSQNLEYQSIPHLQVPSATNSGSTTTTSTASTASSSASSSIPFNTNHPPSIPNSSFGISSQPARPLAYYQYQSNPINQIQPGLHGPQSSGFVYGKYPVPPSTGTSVAGNTGVTSTSPSSTNVMYLQNTGSYQISGLPTQPTQTTTMVKPEYGFYQEYKPQQIPNNNNTNHHHHHHLHHLHKYQSLQDPAYQVNSVQHPYNINYMHSSANVDLLMDSQGTPTHMDNSTIHPMYPNIGMVPNEQQSGFVNMMDNTYIGK